MGCCLCKRRYRRGRKADASLELRVGLRTFRGSWLNPRIGSQASALQGIRRPRHSAGLPQALNGSSAGSLPQIHSQYGQLPPQITGECKLHLSRSGVYCFSGAALAKCHKLGVLYNGNLLSHSSEDQKSKIKVTGG